MTKNKYLSLEDECRIIKESYKQKNIILPADEVILPEDEPKRPTVFSDLNKYDQIKYGGDKKAEAAAIKRFDAECTCDAEEEIGGDTCDDVDDEEASGPLTILDPKMRSQIDKFQQADKIEQDRLDEQNTRKSKSRLKLKGEKEMLIIDEDINTPNNKKEKSKSAETSIQTGENKQLNAALEYAQLGFKVIPLHHIIEADGERYCSCDNPFGCESPGKHPRIKIKDIENRASDDPEVLEIWWETWPFAQIGIITGDLISSDRRLGVMDIDVHDHDGFKTLEDLNFGEFKKTPTARTGSGGSHVYFSYDAEITKTSGRIAPGLEFKVSGYVVAPPGMNKDGPYSWIHSPVDTEIIKIEEWPELLELFEKAKQKDQEPTIIIESEDGKLRPGERQTALLSIAGAVRRKGAEYDEIMALVSAINKKRCQPMLSKERMENIVRSAVGYISEENIFDQQEFPEPEDVKTGFDIITSEELAKIKVPERPRLTNNLEDDHFISQYLEYGKSTCDAYPEFHYGGALTILSVAVDRKLVLKLKQQSIYPNIWSFLLGASTISRKSTAIAKFEDILKVISPNKAIPKSFSPEALIEFLSDFPQAYLVKDEVAQLLSSMRKKYMADIRDFFSEIYDNRDFTRMLRTSNRKNKTSFEIKDPYVTQCVATTNTLFREYTTVLDLTSGWLMRFIYFAPNYKKEIMAFEMATGKEANLYGAALGRASAINRLFHHIGDEKEIHMDPDAMSYYQEWQVRRETEMLKTEDEVSLALWGRLSVYALKLSMLFTVGRAGYGVGDSISLKYIVEACRLVDEYFLPTGAACVEDVGKEEERNIQNKILGTISRKGGKITRRDLLQALHVRLNDVQEALAGLTQSEEIRCVEEQKPGKKSTMWYCLVQEK